MPVFTGGRIRSDISAAELTVMATENRLARTWEELIFNVSSSFYTILGQRKLIEALEFSTSFDEAKKTGSGHDVGREISQS